MADESTPSAQAMRRHTWLRFEEIARQTVRCLPLSEWDEQFIASLTEMAAQSGGELELSDKQLKVLMRFEDRLAIRQLLDQLRGDPRLSAWEEGFLLNLTRYRGDLSEKQLRVLWRIQDNLLAPAEADSQDA
jgi:hypothetical protein